MPSKQTPATDVKASGRKQLSGHLVKQTVPKSERLKRLYTSLCAQIDGGHYTNALKTCDKSELYAIWISFV